MKIRHIILLALSVALVGMNTPVLSDDTEIYLDTSSNTAGQPLVLFTLDYRSNLNSQVCNGLDPDDPNSSECIDLFRVCDANSDGDADDDADDWTVAGDGTRSCSGTIINRPKIQQPADYGDISFFEALRAVLRIVLADATGFRLALMMNHNDTTTGNCSGAGPFDVNDNTCSNGGYVLLGFNGDADSYPYDSSPPPFPLEATLDGGGNIVVDVNGDTVYGDPVDLPDYDDAGDPVPGYGFADHKERFHQILENIPTPQGNVAHPMQGKELYFEFFRYLSGQDVYNGHNGYDDYDSPDSTLNLDNTTQVPDRSNIAWDTLIEDGGQGNQPYVYKSPIYEDCTQIFVINLMFAVSSAEDDSDDAIIGPTSGDMTGIDLSGNQNSFSTVIRYLNRQADLTDLDGSDNVISFFVVDDSQTQQADQKGYAAAGGTGNAIPMGDPVGLAAKLRDLLNDIISVSTTFVSATVPVNVFNRSESLRNVFFGIFQPEKEKLWNGNVKRLYLNTTLVNDTPSLRVEDTRREEAISSVDGRFSHSALSFWTQSGWDDVVAADTIIGEISGRDGRSVHRGGAGQKVQGHRSDSPTALNATAGGRRLFTDPDSVTNGTAVSAMPLEASNASSLWVYLRDAIQDCGTSCALTSWADAATALFSSDGISTTGQEAAANRILFTRGIDIYDIDTDTDRDDSRPWLFGDILHAQPTIVNYGVLDDSVSSNYTEDNPNLRILTAGNDGYIRMMRNNTDATPVDLTNPATTATTDASHLNAGEEVWAFMPREMLTIQGELAGNTQGTHPYGADGGISLYIKDSNFDGTINDADGDKVWAFFGFRRGGQGFKYDASDTPSGTFVDAGKSYYALDLSDPDIPKVLWKISKSDSGGAFAELGQTWSTPRIATLDWGSGSKPVLIFGGGYHGGVDSVGDAVGNDIQPETQADDTEGNAIFIVDASNGSLVWKAVSTGTDSATVHVDASLKDSIPSAVTILDSDGDGDVDRIYVGDTGGVVWRVDMPTADRNNWTTNQILSVGRHAGDITDAADQPDRRFFHPVDVVKANDGSGVAFDGVTIGSGNRAHPKQEFPDPDGDGPLEPGKDGFFVYKDKIIDPKPDDLPSVKTVEDMAEFATVSAASDIVNCADGDTSCTTLLDNLNTTGWWIPLGLNGAGEKILSASVTFEGNIYFTSFVPNAFIVDDEEVGASVICGPKEGLAYTYVVNLHDGTPGFPSFGGGWSINSGAGIPSDPIVIVLDGDVFVTPGNIPTTAEFRGKVGETPLQKSYWYEVDI